MCDYARFSDSEIRQKMQKFDSISHFLQTEAFEYRVFDMGRKVLMIENDEFEKIENQQQFYPYPFQQKALFALLFWPSDKEDEAVIWFLQFPIDELGFLKQASRDAFLIDLLEQTGKNIQAKQAGDESMDQLSESPFAYQPLQDKLAIFHALATKTLGQAPSRYYEATREYLKGSLGFDQWQFLGVQGIADVSARLEQNDNSEIMASAINQLPDEPLKVFAQSIEHFVPNSQLTEALFARLQSELEKDLADNQIVSALIRGSSSAGSEATRCALWKQVLESEQSQEIEVLVALSARAWKDLMQDQVLTLYLEKLSQHNQRAFNAVINDLIKLPDFREPLMTEFQRKEKSQGLTEKVNAFLLSVRKVD